MGKFLRIMRLDLEYFPILRLFTTLMICLFISITTKAGDLPLINERTISLVDTVYTLIQSGRLQRAVDIVKSSKESDSIVRSWLDIQHAIYEIKSDAQTAALFGKIGAEYAVENGYLRTAALMYHNICSFLMPDFDEGVSREDLVMVLQAAQRQVELRRKIKHSSRLIWALWDLGIANLAAGDSQAALVALSEGERIALEIDDPKAAAWCRIFIGKTKVKHFQDLQFEGEREMLKAAKVIRETGREWEKESVGKILKSVWLE